MARFCCLLAVAGLCFTSAAWAEEKLQTWTGSVDDTGLMADAPSVIVSEEGFKKLNKSWNFAKELPKVDFTKNLVVIATTRGSKLGGKPVLKDGDLTFPAFGTRDLRDGFRFLIAEFPKEGVKTFQGKELPKE